MRNIKNAITFADKNNCKPIPIEEVKDYLATTDIVFSSTGSTDFIIKKDDIEIVQEDRKVEEEILNRNIKSRTIDTFNFLFCSH